MTALSNVVQPSPPRARLRCRFDRLRVLLAALLFGLASSAAHAGGMPESAVVVVNADSWASMRVANEYVRLRGIPPGNVIYLPGLSDFERVGVEEFRQQILLPVLEAMRELKRAHPHSAELLYNLACCLALLGNADKAVAALREAAGAGW